MNTSKTFLTVLLFAAAPLLADVAISEHPRPDFQRSAWVNLNGEWQFDFDAKDTGETDGWFKPGGHDFGRQITVPFPWESRLSGIGDTEYKGTAWYSRQVKLPSGEPWDGHDIWLIVGACDWQAKVWVNGQPAGEHVGGYVPFEINLASFAKPGDTVTITIKATDLTTGDQPTGKQVNWYTRTSGIWQTVYLEPRARAFIRSFRSATKLNNNGSATVGYALEVEQPREVKKVVVSSPKGEFQPASETLDQPAESIPRLAVLVDKAQPWSPDSPKLYDAKIELFGTDGKLLDSVNTYFGVREISIQKAEGRDYPYICLNGKPIYLRGALHQSFHPAGIYQYPNDEVLRSDYELCKQIGINFLRIHIKIPVPRELYWADKLGVLIMQDMPCYSKHTPQAQAWWEQMLKASIERDYNHPAIFSWVDFNETWGIGDGGYKADHQEWVEKMYQLTRKLDPTRLVEDNSPCSYDHVATDINSWHFYINDYAGARKHIGNVVEKTFPGSTFNYIGGHTQDNDPLINSEYGGIGSGSGDQDVSWCFKFLTNELRLHEKICGYVYTELSDIEWEHNGFANYDRTPKHFGYDYWHPGMTLQDLNGADFVVIDAPPVIEMKPGESPDVRIELSHWSQRQADKLALRWRTDWVNELGKRIVGEWHSQPAKWETYRVTPQSAIKVDVPAAQNASAGLAPRLGALLVELTDGDTIIARNYTNLLVNRPAPPRVESLDAKQVALRFDPSDFAEWEWADQPPMLTPGIASEKACALGKGQMTYHLQLPAELKLADLESVTVYAEMSAKSSTQRLDWPARRNPNDCPQTDTRQYPTDVRISVNGQIASSQLIAEDAQGLATEAKTDCTLPDDPADARGVLTHLRNYQPGSYGYLVSCKLKSDQLDAIKNSKDRMLSIRMEVPDGQPHTGGLAVFGDKLGGYAMDPTVILGFKQAHGLPETYTSDKPVATGRIIDQRVAIVPDAEHGGYVWAYTTKDPGPDWLKPDFDDRGFRHGKGGFGSRETPNAVIGSRWQTSDIWMRTQFDLPAGVVPTAWRLYHDEDAEVYVNGQRVLERKGFTTSYEEIPLDAATTVALKPGKNTLAVHCHQTGGGQNVDLGLTAAKTK